MIILIVEDNKNKLREVSNFLKNYYSNCIIEEATSFKDGVKKVYENRWNLIILDMTLPTYSITTTENGGSPKPVGGKSIMKRMLNREIFTPVVVITLFETFDEGRISLDSLNREFEKEFSEIWRGTVFYESDAWKLTLKNILDKIAYS